MPLLFFDADKIAHCGGNKETVAYCVKRTAYSLHLRSTFYAVRFTQYADLYTYLRPTVIACLDTFAS